MFLKKFCCKLKRFFYFVKSCNFAFISYLFFIGKSYTEELLEKWIESPNPEKIMKEKLDYIKDSCCSNLVTTVSSKNSEREWTFSFITDRQLCAIALLQDTHRNHFEIKSIMVKTFESTPDQVYLNLEVPNKQEWVLKAGVNMNVTNTVLEYKVTIEFKTDIYGTFRQTAVFDFGSVPVLSRHLCVDVIPKSDVDKVNDIRKEICLSNTERWNSSNSEIVSFSSSLITNANNDSDWAKTITKAYPCPHMDNFTLSHATISEKKLTRNNYRARMHELLYIEEMARYELVAKYNLNAKLTIVHSYLLSPNGMASSTAKYSSSGELFAALYLGRLYITFKL